MKKLLVLIFSLVCVSAEITYPVNVTTDLFTFKLDTNIVRNKKWPRLDGMQLSGAPTNLIILKQSIAAEPTYTNTSHKLDGGSWIDNHNNQTAVFTFSIIPLTVAESNAIAEANIRFNQKTNLANAISTLRSWADQAESTTVTSGNAVATLQTVVNRLGVFFDNFADLMEVGGIDK